MEARVAAGVPGADEESGLLPRSRPPASAARRASSSSSAAAAAQRRAPPPPAVWATVDGPLGMPLEDAEGHARRFFLWGFAYLPMLGAINCYYFWPVLRSPGASSPAAFAPIRPYVLQSEIWIGSKQSVSRQAVNIGQENHVQPQRRDGKVSTTIRISSSKRPFKKTTKAEA